jgi:SAM-dependent methyltransferase
MDTNKSPVRFLFTDLKNRSSATEIMDSADCNLLMLHNTLRQLKFINRYFSGIRPLLQHTLLSHMKLQGGKNYTILDLGAGGCDIPVWLSRTALKHSIRLLIYCIDNDKRVVPIAAENCRGIDGIDIVVGDVFDVLTEYEADYLISNHFIHHLSDDDIIRLLKMINTRSRYGFIINDLLRSRVSLFFFFMICPLFFRNSYALRDGLKSITRGFKADDLKRYRKIAGVNSSISYVSPGHICMYSLT